MPDNVAIFGQSTTLTTSPGGDPRDEAVKSTSNSLHVRIDGNITSVSGTFKSYNMTPVAQASANFSNAKECYSNSTGVMAFRVIPGVAITSNEAVVVGWSTTASDQTNVKSLIDAVTTTTTGTWDAPDGASHVGVMQITSQAKDFPWVLWDGSTKIKTIGLELSAAIANMNCVIETIE